MPDARVRHGRLPVEHQAHRLNRLNRKRLMSFDQGAMMSEVVNPHGIAGIVRSPEGAEHFKTDLRPTIPCCAHQCPQAITVGVVQAGYHCGDSGST